MATTMMAVSPPGARARIAELENELVYAGGFPTQQDYTAYRDFLSREIAELELSS